MTPAPTSTENARAAQLPGSFIGKEQKVFGLYDDADLYDLVSPPDEAMERFYVEAVGGHGRKVLELACGSGRFTIPLAKSGARVTGGDLSETMLEKARERVIASGVEVQLVKLDMRDFELDMLFDSVLIAANSLLHMHTAEDFAQAFAAKGHQKDKRHDHPSHPCLSLALPVA